MPGRRLRFGIKVAQMAGRYAEMREAWLEADRLGFDTAWAHDHLLNPNDPARAEDEGWTVLTALLVQTRRIRGGDLQLPGALHRRRGALALGRGRPSREGSPSRIVE